MGLNRQIAMLNKGRTDEVDIDAVSSGSTTPVVREHKRIRTNPRHEPVRFTIVYCHNCDGGLQEMTTAAKCVRDAFPRAAIVGERIRQMYLPIQLRIVAHFADEDNHEPIVVWEGDQRLLFQKYPAKRAATRCEIRRQLQRLQTN